MQEYINKHYNSLNNLEYLGWVNDLNNFFRTLHVCIVSSLLDAGPVTVAEAMYCGLPVIVNDGCGAKSLVKDSENGFVFPAEDSATLIKMIEWFFNNQNEIPKMGKNAIQTLDNLTQNDQYKKAADHIIEAV